MIAFTIPPELAGDAGSQSHPDKPIFRKPPCQSKVVDRFSNSLSFEVAGKNMVARLVGGDVR